MTNTVSAASSSEPSHSLTKAHPKTIYLADYEPPHYWVDTVDLVFDLHDNYTEVKSKLAVRRNEEVANKETPLVLLAKN